MASESATRQFGRCHHCGRPVHETMHTRTGFNVDFYSLHTGEVEPVTLSRPDENGDITVMRLLNPIEVITCVECYQRAAIRDERERLFRPEVQPEAEPA